MSLSEVQISVVIIRVSEEGEIRERSYDLPVKRNDNTAGSECPERGNINTQCWELPDA